MLIINSSSQALELGFLRFISVIIHLRDLLFIAFIPQSVQTIPLTTYFLNKAWPLGKQRLYFNFEVCLIPGFQKTIHVIAYQDIGIVY